MVNARKAPELWVRAGLWLLVAVLAPALCPASGKDGASPVPEKSRTRELSSRFPAKPSIAPAWSIPMEPLGFAAPGQNYLGMRNAMASLDFLGEDRLLFTFRAPGLMRREPENTSDDQRQIRAVVLALPSGAVQSETNWTLHDRWRYLWLLDDDHFLLRDRDTICEGDPALNRKPLLHFPGELLSIELNPGRQYLVANSREPAPAAAAKAAADDPSRDTAPVPDLVLRILHRDSGQVMMVTRIRTPVELPINNDGYLSALRGNGMDWTVAFDTFSGQTRALATVKSACIPQLQFLSEGEALVTACTDSGENVLTAITTTGATLWTDMAGDQTVWPQTAIARNGLRFARETLYISHPMNAFAPLGADDIKGQWVQVFDAANGNLAFESPATPILDVGGNVAVSPSGRRVAVLNAGAIQVFELPEPPPLPDSAPSNDAP